MNEDSIRHNIARDHEYADSLGIFGTPTFVFDDGEVVFLKTFPPAPEDSVAEFERQKAKTIAAIVAMNADVLGLVEIENDGPTTIILKQD